MDIDSARRAKHLLHAHAHLVFRSTCPSVFDLLGPQERAGQHHVSRLICLGFHSGLWRRDGSRWGAINSKIHVLHFLGDFKLVSKTPGSRPNEQIRRCPRFHGLDENLVGLSLDLKVRTASGRHRDRLVKFQNRQVVQGGRNVDDGIRAGSAGLLRQCGDSTEAIYTEAMYKDERNRSFHNPFLSPERNPKGFRSKRLLPHMTQGTSLASSSLKVLGRNSTASSTIAAGIAHSAAMSVSAQDSLEGCAWACSGFSSSRRTFPSLYLNKNVCFCPPPLSGSTRKVRPEESVRTSPS